MSRTRYLKPGFFTDDDLGECSPLARLLFEGLWTIADREGRLEDRPRRIKAQLLPYDDCDCNNLLDELSEHGGLIIRYQANGANGGRYIAIPGWLKHQKPHSKELESEIPEPASSDLNPASSDLNPASSPLACARNPNPNSNSKRTLAAPECGDGQMNLDGVVVSVAPAADDGFEQWWSTYPRKQGKKSAALSKWSKLKPADKRAAREVTEKMRAIVAAGGKDLNYVPYATTFLNGRRWEEWSDGTPPDWGGSNGQGKPAIDPAVESELQPWQRYCLSWFDEHGWNTSHRTDMSREEDQALRNAVEYGELSRDDVLAGKHPCSL